MFTMFKIKASRQQGENFYHEHLSANDYYSEKENVKGLWKGSLASEFNIEGQEVSAEVFSQFQQNINPVTNDKLTKRTRTGGIRFYDFQCSSQKSVSIMSLFDDRLVHAHRRSVDYAMKEIERFAAVRIRKGENIGTNNFTNTGQIVYAQFHHDSSRTLDPQLHAHNVVANVTWDAVNGEYKALETLDICKAIRYAGKAYQNKLASECRRLGYDIEITRDNKGIITGFELVGISKTENEQFSKRRKQIEAGIERFRTHHGRSPSYDEISEITRSTRGKKMLESSKNEVLDFQKSQFSPERQKELEKYVDKLKSKGSKLINIDDDLVKRQLSNAVDMIFERDGVLTEDKIYAEALNQNLGNADLDKFKNHIYNTPGLVKLTDSKHNPYYSTKLNIELEKYVVSTIDNHKELCPPLNPDFMPFENVTEHETKAQSQALKQLLRSPDRFMLLRGVAGAGKTTVLKEFCKGLQAAGISPSEINVIAPTNSAVSVLRNDGFDYSETVAKYLLPNSFSDNKNNKVVIIDESGLNSIKQGYEIINNALTQNKRVLFVGDARQHTSVDAGDFFRIIETYSQIEKVSLEDIHRQKVKDYKNAIYNCAMGNFNGAFEIFDRNGWIVEGKGKYIENAANDFIKLSNNGLETFDTIAVAPTHRECDLLTDSIRIKLKENQLLEKEGTQTEHFKSYRWTKSQICAEKNYFPGQNICFIANIPDVAFAGETAKVEKVQKGFLHLTDGRKIYIKNADSKIDVGDLSPLELCKGDVVSIDANYSKRDKIFNGARAVSTGVPCEFELLDKNNNSHKTITLPKNFKAFSYSWVTTSHKSQGRTTKNVIVAAENIDRKAFYVGCSRGKYEVKIHCPDKNHLAKSLIRRDGNRLAVHDLKDIGLIEFKPERPKLNALNPDELKSQKQKHIDFTSSKALDISVAYNKIQVNRKEQKVVNL